MNKQEQAVDINIAYDKEREVIIYTSGKSRTIEESKEVTKILVEHIHKFNCHHILCDSRNIKAIPDVTRMLDLAKFQNTIPEAIKTRTAIVCSDNHEIAKGYHFYAELCTMAGYKIKCFTDIDEAYKWLKSKTETNTSSTFNFPI